MAVVNLPKSGHEHPLDTRVCCHAAPRRVRQGAAARAWMDRSAWSRLAMVMGLAIVGAVLVVWATAV